MSQRNSGYERVPMDHYATPAWVTTAPITAEASRIVLAGFELSSDAHITCYPDRYRDPGGRGDKMWRDVMNLIARRKTSAAA